LRGAVDAVPVVDDGLVLRVGECDGFEVAGVADDPAGLDDGLVDLALLEGSVLDDALSAAVLVSEFEGRVV